MGPSSISRSWPATFLLAVLFVSVVIGLSAKPAHAQEILSVNAPSQARPGDWVHVRIEIRYELAGPVDLSAVIQDRETGEEVGSMGFAVGEEGEVISRTMEVGVGIGVPSADRRVPPYTWQLVASCEASSMDFEIPIIPTDAEPTVNAIGAKARPADGDEEDDIYVGDIAAVFFDFEFSVPPFTSVKLLAQNNLGIYPAAPAGVLTEEDGWIAYESIPSEDTSRSDHEQFPYFADAPLHPTDDWRWTFRVVAETVDGNVVQDETSLTVVVLDVEDRQARIRDVSMRDSVAPGETFPAIVTGVYLFPGDSRGDIQVQITQEDGAPVRGGATHEVRDLRGRGMFRVEFSITAPDVEGRWDLSVQLRISGDPDPVHEIPREIVVSSDVSDEVRYCRILALRVNGGDPVQRIAYGTSFMVELDISWDLPPDSHVTVTIWDWDWVVTELMFDYFVASGEEDSYTYRTAIEGIRIPPRNGLWTLRAEVQFNCPGLGQEFTPDGWERVFQVEVVDAAPSVGGRFDWSIGEVQVSPYEPLASGLAVFEGKIRANPVPGESKHVRVVCQVDGEELFSDYVTYDPGIAFLTVISAPWITTLGTHRLTWVVDPDPAEYDDPNRANNIANLEFSVVEAYPPPEIGPGEEPPPPGEMFDFYVTAVPVEQTVRSPVTYAINVEVMSGTPEPVMLELIGAPSGASYYFAPTSGTPTYTSTLTVTTAAYTPAGTYGMAIKASGGGIERYQTITLKVEGGPDYNLSVTPRSARGRSGQRLEFKVSVSSDTGYSQYVNLLVSGAPSGIAWNLDPSASTPNFNSTLTVELGKNVRPGTYRLIITGSGPEGKTTTITITVEGEPAPLGTPENTINTFASAILGIIVAAIAGGTFFAIRRFRGRGKKSGAFCIDCGTGIPPGSDFCPKCGSKQTKA